MTRAVGDEVGQELALRMVELDSSSPNSLHQRNRQTIVVIILPTYRTIARYAYNNEYETVYQRNLIAKRVGQSQYGYIL
jgi:hypothetical protein